MPQYRIAGVIEIDITADSPEAALEKAEAKLYATLDTHAKRLRAVVGMDVVTDRKTGDYLKC
jgi:hypothetical protein